MVSTIQNIPLDLQKISEECKNKGYDFNEEKFWGRFYNLYEDESIVKKDYDGVTYSGPSRKVKVLEVNPNTELKLQKHHLKTETWISLSDNMRYDIGSDLDSLEQKTLNTMDVTFVDIGQIHRIINPNDYPIFVYEIQEGVCSEEDVIRF